VHAVVKSESQFTNMEHEIEAAERERLSRLSEKWPAWLKALWTLLSFTLALLVMLAMATNLKALLMGKGSVGTLFLNLLVAVVPLLLIGDSRDLWMLPKALKGEAKTWLL
jgi:hypothetical protein